MNDNIPRHDMAKIREAFAVGVCHCSDCVDFRRPLADAIDELEALRAEVAKKDARIAELEAEVEEDRQSAMERSEHD